MAKFDNAKVGDRVYDIIFGRWGEIIIIAKGTPYPLLVDFGDAEDAYSLDGTSCKLDKCPRLYWNEVKLPTDEEDKKPFNLVEFLKENLKPKEFEKGEDNYYFFYDTNDENFCFLCDRIEEVIGAIYFCNDDDINDVLDKLEEQEIKPEELKHAFRELEWL